MCFHQPWPSPHYDSCPWRGLSAHQRWCISGPTPIRPLTPFRPTSTWQFTAARWTSGRSARPLGFSSRMFGPLARPSQSARQSAQKFSFEYKNTKTNSCRMSDVQFSGWSRERMGSRADQHFNPSAHSPPS